MNICFVVNKNYIGQLKVALYSIFCTNREYIHFYILHNDLDSRDEIEFYRFVNEYNNDISFIKLDDEMFNGLPKMGYDKSYTAYFKLMIPYIFKQLDKVLYLDCDLIVEKPLKELYQSKRKHFISAVLDEKMNKKRKEHIERVVGQCSNLYFNSGVILFDFSYENEIVEQETLFNYIKLNKDVIKFHDQDILNRFYIFKNDIMDEKYNYVTTYKSILDVFFAFGGKKAVIIHYANWKPWNDNYIGKFYRKYLRVYNTVRKKEKIDFLKKRNIISMIKLIYKYIVRGK